MDAWVQYYLLLVKQKPCKKYTIKSRSLQNFYFTRCIKTFYIHGFKIFNPKSTSFTGLT